MRIEVRPFRPSDVPAILSFNARLAAASVPHDVGWEGSDDADTVQRPITERLYVAVDGEEIRGGVWLKEQLCWSIDGPIRVGWAMYPVAESLISGSAAGVPASLVFKLLREQPNLMALGMGGHAGPYAKLLAAMRWTNSSVPFFLRLVHPDTVLRQLSNTRRSAVQRLAVATLASTGLARAGNTVLSLMRSALKPDATQEYGAVVVSCFEEWADQVWARCRDSYGFLTTRDSQALNALYPQGFKRLVRLRVRRNEQDVGWVCVRSIDSAGTWFERHLGSVNLGIVTDALAEPGHAKGVMAVAARYLLQQDVDLIVTSQTHPTWCAATVAAGFWRGPSRSAFYRSQAIERVIARAAAQQRYHHLTWSDGDGPESV